MDSKPAPPPAAEASVQQRVADFLKKAEQLQQGEIPYDDDITMDSLPNVTNASAAEDEDEDDDDESSPEHGAGETAPGN